MASRLMLTTLLTAFMVMDSAHGLSSHSSDGGQAGAACLLQSTFAASDLSVDSAAEVQAAVESGFAKRPKAALLLESDTLETSVTQTLMLRSETRSRSCKAHLLYLNRKVNEFDQLHNVSNKKIDEVVKGFISKQSGSEDACSSQLMEAKHQLNQIHQYVSDLVVQVNHTELAIVALDGEMKEQLKAMQDLEKWLEKELAVCEEKRQEYIEMYKKLSAEMEEMKQIASPGVAMDVKTGKVTTGLVQVKNHSAGVKDMQKLHLLMKGTQSAAKQYMTCMAHQSGRKARVSDLQQSVAVDSIGGSDLSRECSLGNYWCKLLDGAGISSSDQSKVTTQNGQWYYNGQSTKVGNGGHSDNCDSAIVFCAGGSTFGWGKKQAIAVKAAIDNGGVHPSAPETAPKIWKQKKFSTANARCKGSPVNIPGKKGMWGTDWNNLGQKDLKFTKQQCKDACLEQPLCKFATFNQDNGHCTAFNSCDKGEKIDIWKKGSKKGQAKAFLVWEKVPVKDETPDNGDLVDEGGSEGADPFGSFGLEGPSKPDDPLDEDDPSLTPDDAAKDDNEDEAEDNDGKVGGDVEGPVKDETPDIGDLVDEGGSEGTDPGSNGLEGPSKPDDPLDEEDPSLTPDDAAKDDDESDEAADNDDEAGGDVTGPVKDETPDIGDLVDEGGSEGSEGQSESGSAEGEGFNGATTNTNSIDSLRDENDQAAMDAAEAIKSSAASPEKCAEEKEILEQVYVKTYVELSRLKNEYSDLANSTACFDNAKSLYESKKVPIQEKIDELIKDIDEKVRELQGLRPRLEDATKAEAELRKHIATLTEECAQLPETISNLDKVRDAIEALSKCPGLSRIQFSLPKWVGKWVEFELEAKDMTDGNQDKAMDTACAEAAQGTRAAEVGEIAEQTVEHIPETNTAELPLIGTCPQCQGDEATDFPSGHKRICWKQGANLTPAAKSTNCASGKKTLLCVIDRENIRQIPGES